METAAEFLDLFASDPHEAQQDKLNEDDEMDEGIMMDEEGEAGDEPSSKRADPEGHGNQRDSAADSESSPISMFGDIGVFRDFFLAAFSDGYYNVRCFLILASIRSW